MNRYDAPLKADLSENTPIAKILKNLKPGQTILEFGPANGRMTRYMKEQLGCDVFIVEIDSNAFEVAMQYAKKGVCGNILDYIWKKEFQNIQFDVILFCDVLEHLTAPAEALSNALELLKEDGDVFVSLPNIAHNAVIIELLKGRFFYQSTGLLDETHVHFFTHETAVDMFDNCNLKIVWEDGIYISSLDSEFGNTCEQLFETADAVRANPFGEVYQLVFGLKKASYYEKYKTILEVRNQLEQRVVRQTCNVFFDMGQGFLEKSTQSFTLFYTDRSPRFSLEIIIPEGTKRIRFDPVEKMACAIQDFAALCGGEALSYENNNGISVGTFMVFTDEDPNITISLFSHQFGSLWIHGKLYAFHPKSHELINGLIDLSAKMLEIVKIKEIVESQVVTLQQEREDRRIRYQQGIAHLTAQKELLERDYTDLVRGKIEIEALFAKSIEERDQWNKKFVDLRDECRMLTVQHQELTAQHQELTAQHQELTAQHQELIVQHQELTVQHQELTVQHQELTVQHQELTAEYRKIVDARWWKLFKPLRYLVGQWRKLFGRE